MCKVNNVFMMDLFFTNMQHLVLKTDSLMDLVV